MKRQQTQQVRRRIAGWRLGGIVGVIGGVALALSIVIAWGHPSGSTVTHGPYNRFFADEAGYTATIAEYLAPDQVLLNTYATEAISHETTWHSNQPVCRMLVGFGIALCESGRQSTHWRQHEAQPIHGPR